MYSFLLGALILLQLVVQMRHFRNLNLFRAAADAIRGRIEYSRRLMLRSSAFELFEFSCLFFVLFAFTGSWFILGGAVGCFSVAVKHRGLAIKHGATAANADNSEETAPAQRSSL